MHLSLHISCSVAECFLKEVSGVQFDRESSRMPHRRISFSVFTVQFCSHAGSVNSQVELIQFC